MLRWAARIAAIAVLWLVVPPRADAQALDRLHVVSFDLVADPGYGEVGDRIELTIRLSVKERVSEIHNITLPTLFGFQNLGDERSCTSSAHGTDCTETIVLEAETPGTYRLGPAELDAINASNGRPERLATNGVTITVLSGNPIPQMLVNAFWATAQPLIEALLVLVAILTLLYVWGRRPQPAYPNAPTAPPMYAQPAPVAPVSEAARWRALVDALAAEPTRPRVLAVRGELRRYVGAGERETLGDLLARNAMHGNESMIAAMRSIELAAFVGDDGLAPAIRDALPRLQAVNGAMV